LKDRARSIQSLPTETRVEGKTVMANDVLWGDWFKARLSEQSRRETTDGGGTWRTVKNPSLLFGVKDTYGQTLLDTDEGGSLLKARDRVEVDSVQLGRAVYELTGDPQPIRKKRRLIGFEAPLQRVDRQPHEESHPS
jgi:hypothetical protein